MSSENQETDQFKLISLDSNSIKPVAQKARQAYSSYGKEESSENTSALSINEDAPETAVVVEKKEAPPVPQPKAPKQQPKSVVQKFKEKEPDYDEEEYEDVSLKIDELKESISTLWSNFYETFSAVVIKVGSVILKPFVIIAGLMARLMSIPLRIINKMITALAGRLGVKTREEKAEAAEEEVPVQQIKKSTFNDMVELNIIFTDNYKKNLYNKSQNAAFKLSKMEEQLIMANAMDAIRECAEFTAELPPPTEGIYSGVSISRIMEEVTEEDVNIFLGFVKAFPGKYIGKTWKISETFATWLINNSPLG